MTLTLNQGCLEKIKLYAEEFKDVPLYGLIWESVSGREIDKGWVFKIDQS